MDEAPDLRARFPTKLFEPVRQLASELKDAGGHALVVGGSVRDVIMGEQPTEMDLEVRGLAPDDLRSFLAQRHGVGEFGKAFGVLKLKALPIEIALPRAETKVAAGHRGFSVEVDPHLPFIKAAARRDYTINAMGLDPLTNELLDPHGGKQDLDDKVLRHVGPAFVEDPLRVLRGMQFAARFDLVAVEDTIALCKTIDLEGLAVERILEEWEKLILKGKSISAGLRFLRESSWLRFFPELEALVDCKQDPEWHPEGDVWIHTLHCMDAFATSRVEDPWEDLVVGFAVLCHDFGKPETTKTDEDGRIRSLRHETKGEEPTRSFLARMTNQADLVEQVVPLVRRHLTPRAFHKDQAGDSAIRRLAREVSRIDRLVRVAAADMAGRPPKSAEFPEGDWLLKRADALRVKDSSPAPIVLGRHLIERGLVPGPAFKPLLDECFEAQLDGLFDNLPSGLAHLSQLLATQDLN